ncbi:unnamed protein product [Rangifer tarandus platyrhynchus]|uniref:Uncharacterized protein n=2 Tax=Rangifer tarandus platyrhynchus TaxID=3082113 RepID=A0ABN8XWT4_RANTA|nr:unnamed protein product [Rangifer tarandus platyrhynchus]CAI9713522.1 unnamed protein product [Rangifer tarandus platyrhynchus]
MSWKKRPDFFPGPPIHVCRSISLSFQPFCSPLLPVLGSLGPRSHCQLCPDARSHPVEPARPQPCDLPRGHSPRWRPTGPGLETLLGFKSPKADMNSSFCPPASPLLCPSGPTELAEARQTQAPAHSSLSGTLPLYPSGLPPPPSANVFSRHPAPSPPGHTQASHTSSPVLTCFPTWPQLQGGNLASVTLRQLLPLTDTPSPPPPLSYLGLAQRSHPSLTSLPEISVSAWGQHLAKPPDGPAPTLGGFCLDNFAYQCQGDRVPCPALASHVSSWASCWLDASSETPPSLTKQSMLFSPEDAIRLSRQLMSHQIIISLFTV